MKKHIGRWSLRIFAVASAVVMLRSAANMQAPVAELPSDIPRVMVLSRSGELRRDLRGLPQLPAIARVHHPLLPAPALAVGGADGAAQVTAPNLPAPAPGGGGDASAGAFPGLDFAHWGDGWPPDTNGDVGPAYYIQTVNTSIGIFDKANGSRVAAFTFNTLMSEGTFGNLCDTDNFGDPVVVYDTGTDHWFITDFAFALNASGQPVAPYYQCFAVSKNGDPVTGGWNFYSLAITDLFPDYPKFGIWPDGLYMTANMFGTNTFRNVRVWALDKNAMEAGATAHAVMFNLPSNIRGVSIFSALPSTYHVVTGTPPVGRVNFISAIWSAKVAHVWKFHVDWSNTANSTLTGPSNVALATWGVAGTTVPAQNGNPLDTLRERLMAQSQYTNLGTLGTLGTESLWLTHTVANPRNSALTSPRWYQINVTGSTVVTSAPVQQSTWAPDSTAARWMASLAVDKLGDMAIGYSVSSTAMFPAIRWAGRLASDPASTLGQTEASLIEGTASQCCTFSNGSTNTRWGDYSAMTIDPNGCDFWYTNEYYQSPQPTTVAQDNWQTQIGSFRLNPSCTTTP